MQDEHLETGQAMIMTMERISTFHLFFPLNQLAFTGMLLAICIGAFVIFYMHNTALKTFLIIRINYTVMLDFEVKRIENNMMRDMLTTENISILSPKAG